MITTIQKAWGKEEWIVNNSLYCYKKLYLKEGYCCSTHYHKLKDETFIVESGKVLLDVFDTSIVMLPGEQKRVEPYVKHRFSGIEDSVIIEISTTHFEDDSYRESVSGKI